jgi:hypothetical protein
MPPLRRTNAASGSAFGLYSATYRSTRDHLDRVRLLPDNWDEIAPGHLVIAQESLANGWWEAIVLDRKDDMLTLRFRDYPRLPKFFRHRTAVALVSPGRSFRHPARDHDHARGGVLDNDSQEALRFDRGLLDSAIPSERR